MHAKKVPVTGGHWAETKGMLGVKLSHESTSSALLGGTHRVASTDLFQERFSDCIWVKESRF